MGRGGSFVLKKTGCTRENSWEKPAAFRKSSPLVGIIFPKNNDKPRGLQKV